MSWYSAPQPDDQRLGVRRQKGALAIHRSGLVVSDWFYTKIVKDR